MQRLSRVVLGIVLSCGVSCADDPDAAKDAAAPQAGAGSGAGVTGGGAGAGGTSPLADAGHDASITSPPTRDASTAGSAAPTMDAGQPSTTDAAVEHDAAPNGTPHGPLMVYVGNSGSSIHVFAMDPSTLALTPKASAPSGAAPSFLAFDPMRRWLVAVDEEDNAVESFAIDAQTGLLSHIDQESSTGDGPAHVSIDRSGHWVLVANYDGGSAAVLPITQDGMLAPAVATVQPGANAHQIFTDADNTTAYVPCLGADHVAVYGFDASSGALSARAPAAAPQGAGPRHMVLDAEGKFAWLMNEIASSVTTYEVSAGGGLVQRATVSALPANFSGDNSGAEIAVHPSGRWVYSSNRGQNSIAVFAVGDGGALTLIANAPTGGEEPRHFSLALDGTAMLVANQRSGNVHGFWIDADSGLLTDVGELATVAGAEFVAALELPQ